ncbi:HTH-type transcriptional activator RhaR [bioreactor metagenome]|uniref:HTH-type transcriptional activator RhaR n=1 Tax=bioreactor metagenome TaxID=1076179 RepID=A0A645C5B4_9ZZZZ|nr:AraC family transcriptional regulator [Candidatus Pelethousia sp.]
MYQDQLELLHIFHFSTGLPVVFYAHGDPVESLPESISSVSSFLGEERAVDALSFSPGQLLAPQYIANPYGERYLYFQINADSFLLVGPVLTEPIMEGTVSNLIRLHRLPIKRKSALTEHYAGLPLISETAFFFTGKLLELLFYPIENTQDVGGSPATAGAVVEQYQKGTYENRMKLFQHPPYFMEQEICRLITAGDKRNAAKHLRRINTLRRAVLAKDPLRSLKNSLICSCTLFTRAAIAGGAGPDDAFTLSDTYILEIESNDSIRILDDLEARMVADFVDMVNRINEARYSKVIRNAIEYINNNLSERITVTDIADNVFVHPNYLSSLFKKETGTSISSYITSHRVEEAKYFIRYSSNSLSDIANFYQFCSQSHFIAAFKKQTGLTPAQYRNQST